MEIEEKIKKQIAEINEFIEKQIKNIEENEKDILTGISNIDSESMRAKISAVLIEAKKGNIKNVQNLSKNILSELENNAKCQ